MPENAQTILARYGEVPDGYDPEFPWTLDLAPQRKELADSLTRLFKQSNKPFVLAVNAGWGMGKSLFLRMWRDDLQNQGHPCVLFNAWEYDHTDTPLLSFITALDRQVNTNWPEKLKQKGKGFLKSVPQKIPGLLNAVVQGATAAFCPGTGVEGVAGQSAQALAEAVIEGSKQVVEDRDAFRKELAGFAKKLTQESPGPLIVMVDELDRCRPDFAIALLEDIKHLFSVEGVVFVLAVEKKQLSNCIGATYGLDSDGANTYLNKFIDMTMELPEPDTQAFMRMLTSAYPLTNPDNWPAKIYRKDFIPSPPNDTALLSFADVAIEIISQFPLSLRDIAQVFCRLSVIVQRKNICSLTAIACAPILAWMQKNGSMEQGIQGLYQFSWNEIPKEEDRIFSMAPKLYDTDSDLCRIMQHVHGLINPEASGSYKRALLSSANTLNLPKTGGFAAIDRSRPSHLPQTREAWIAHLKECLLLTERLTVE